MSVLAVLKEWVTGEVNASGVEVVDYDLEGGSGSGGRRRGALYRLPSSRGKSIFTIICKHKEDAHKAAQYLKSGSAVFVNLQSIDRSKGQRIVDVLSGVCYGLDGQCHCAGDRVFVFVPYDFTLTADDKGQLLATGLFADGFEAPKTARLTDEPPAEMRTGLFARNRREG